MEDYLGARTRKAMNERLDEVRGAIRMKCAAVETVRDIADVTKHSMLAVPPNRERSILSVEKVTRTPGLFDAPWGHGYTYEAQSLYFENVDGTKVSVMHPIRTVFDMWEAELFGPQSS